MGSALLIGGALAFFGGPVGNSPVGRPPGGGVVGGGRGRKTKGLATSTTTIPLTVVEVSGSGSRLVNAGIPLVEAQASSVNNIALWLNTGSGMTEVACYVESLAPHLDGSIRSVLVQWTGDPDTITSAELRIGAAFTVSRASSTTAPARPAATLMPSATHLIACDLFPFVVVPSSDAHADYSGYDAMFSDIGHHTLTNDDTTRGKYARAMWAFYWLTREGPGVTNASTFFDIGCATAEKLYTDDTAGNEAEFNDVDAAGSAVHYLLTGYTNSRTRVGQFAARWGGGWDDWQGGGRRIFHAAEAMMYAYLLDIDDVTHSGSSRGPYTKAQHIANLEARVTTWDAGWTSGDPSLPVAIEGLHNVDGNATTTYGPDAVLAYMNAMMHIGVMRCFVRLAGESSTLDALRAAWETAMINAADYFLNDADGYDDTAGVDTWVYALYLRNGEGAGNAIWTAGGNVNDWNVQGTAEAGTDTNTIIDTGVFTDASVGDVIYNSTRDEFDTIQSKTSDDEVELTGTITGQTTGDAFTVRAYDYADKTFPGTTDWPFWWSGFVNTLFWYAYEAASGAQATSFKDAARTGLLANITRWGLPGTSSQWGTYDQGGGAGFYVSGASVDEVGVNGGLQWLASQSEWMDLA